jgi:hypothetical protein
MSRPVASIAIIHNDPRFAALISKLNFPNL